MKRLNKSLLLAIIGLIGSAIVQASPDFVAQQVANQVSRNISEMITKNLTDRILYPQLKIRNPSGKVKDFAVSADEHLFALLHDDSTVRVWDAQHGVQRPIIKSGPSQISGIAIVSRFSLALLARADGNIDLVDIYTGKVTTQLQGKNNEIVALSVSKNEDLLAVGYEDGVVLIWNLTQQRLQQRIHTSYGDGLKHLQIEANGLSFITAGENGFVDRWDINKGEKVAELSQQDQDIIQLWVGQVDGQVIVFDEDEIYQQFDGKGGSSQHEISQNFLALALNQDLSLIALATEDQAIKVLNSKTLQLIKSFNAGSVLSHLYFINNAQHLIGADEKGVLHIYKVATGQEILKLISTNTGWTVVDDHGRFDSSELAMSNVSWQAETVEIPIDSFSEDYYEPGLMATQIKQQAFINQQPKPIAAGIKLPPQVKVIAPEQKNQVGTAFVLTVEAQGLGGGVKDLTLYHNAKKLNASAQLDSQEQVQDGLIKKTSRFNVLLTAGVNTFKAVARNTMGIEGHSEPISIDVKGILPKIRLHVVTVGINKYKDPRLNLDYSVADGQSIAQLLNDKRRVRFDSITQHGLFDQQATKAEILKQLKKKNHFDQNDVLVVYLAGHGLAIDGQWYFLPHEAELKDSIDYYKQVGISALEIQQVLAEINAQKILLMIDSCYSGAGLQAFIEMQNSQRYFSRSVSKTAGIVVLAATRKDQEAAESVDLGHGLFTYIVSQGLRGAADYKPLDQQISAHEIADYSTTTMPAFSRKYLGASQEPTAFSLGQDFILLEKN